MNEDELEKMASGAWIPKIKKLDIKDDWDFETKYDYLEHHHKDETLFLMRVVQELAIELNIAIIQRDSFAEQVNGLEDELLKNIGYPDA